MTDTVLFPTDGSDAASEVLDHALNVAEIHDATVHVLNVADTTQESLTRIGHDVVDALEHEGEQIVQEAAEHAEAWDVPVVTDVQQGQPYRMIVEYADQHGIDLIVMPTHGRTGLERLLLGSVTERVIRRSDVPVLTIRPDHDAEEHYPYQNVLVPTDGSECATAALRTGIDVVNTHEATLHLISVVELVNLGTDVHSEKQADVLEDHANEVIDEAVQFAEEAAVESITSGVEYGSSVHREIHSYLDDHDIDVVVIGTHGRTGFDRYMLGSVTEQLVRTSPVPVMAVRTPETSEE